MAALFFAASMFASAALLFLVEPMLARMLLPLLGGSPAVWNTCMVFFQAALLAGYLYAHASTRWLGRRTQIVIHVALVASALLVLPLAISQGTVPPAQNSPVFWILGLLTVTVGLPFLALSAGTPVLQSWFSQTTHTSAADPYFLYAASNAGSLIGLLGYPVLLEPLLPLGAQTRFWSVGYIVLLLLTALCAAVAWRGGTRATPQPAERGADIPWLTRARWIALAFVPSSLMLGVTTALTTDVPSIPFFWVMPLALYLLSFVLVFATKPPIPHAVVVQRLPFVILLALIPTITKTRLPIEILLFLYLLTLFAVAIVCHGELARGRPSARHLTEFYLWISVGGVLGGIFNSLLAPVLFRSVVEFPLALVLAALLRPPVGTPGAKRIGRRTRRLSSNMLDWILPLAIGVSMLAVIEIVRRQDIKPGLQANALIFGYPVFLCLSFSKRPLRFALGVAALVLASTTYTGAFGRVLYTERSFFGVSRVAVDGPNQYRSLFHGGTVHGLQSLDPARSREPLAYYTRSGPVGQIFDALSQAPAGRVDAVAIVGLGAGAMACHLQPGQPLTYYEIDPSIQRIASDPRYFTFLSQCAPQTKIVLGDARLSLRNASDAEYGLIILDAFSGDSIPMHLLTREAVRLYLTKLAPGGLLVFHISNRYLDLAPTLGLLARDAGLADRLRNDILVPPAELDRGKMASSWAVLARRTEDFGGIVKDPRWGPLPVRAGARVWTDDYSNLLGIIRWQ